MTKEVQEKLNQSLLLTKALTEKFERLDPVHDELATAFACIGRAKRMLAERAVEVAEVEA
jgi:hypothetical protein